MAFQKAERKQKKARIALYGPSGSGKTYTALSLATGLGDKIAVIDTERGSASLYADRFNFDSMELSNFNPEYFISAIADAEKAGYDVLIIDSLSHAWQGTGGILDKVTARGGNGFTDGWGKVGTPLYNKLIDTILESRLHIIACMRSKTEYVMEKNDKGKDVPKKVGMGVVMRHDAEYEFDYVGLLDDTNTMTTQKTRMGEVLPDAINRPNKATGAKILAWLTSGAAQVAPAPKPVAPKVEPDPMAQKAAELGGVVRNIELPPADWKDQIKVLGALTKKYMADADVGLSVDISAAQSAARALLQKDGVVTKDEFTTVTDALNSVIDRAEALQPA